MKVVAIYGNGRKGSTYSCVQIVKRAMEACGDVEFQEIWLPRDLPMHCLGCFNCILRSEQSCPHQPSVSPLIESLVSADGIIMASPVYGLEVSGAMKTFIDHLCFMWMPHRPHSEMFSKVGFAISTAAGGGTGRANKTMKHALDQMGVKRTLTFGASVAASCWEDIKESKRASIERTLSKKAISFYRAINSRKTLRVRVFTKVFFWMMKKMISGYEDGNVDKEFWREHGWLKNEKPF